MQHMLKLQTHTANKVSEDAGVKSLEDIVLLTDDDLQVYLFHKQLLHVPSLIPHKIILQKIADLLNSHAKTSAKQPCNKYVLIFPPMPR